ncbi:hypothetical protein GCM10009550_78670 [Actinocorallia libanotica]|uniref:Uncharacterized protein n=1 Tax=Actinocorallia libanotica TaxID=46162 RepID=A0ABN1S290_9ACTN
MGASALSFLLKVSHGGPKDRRPSKYLPLGYGARAPAGASASLPPARSPCQTVFTRLRELNR